MLERKVKSSPADASANFCDWKWSEARLCVCTSPFQLVFRLHALTRCSGLEEGMYIRYCFDGSLFDLRRLKANRKTLQTLIQEDLFADNCALMAHKDRDLQLMHDRFSEASKLLGLTSALAKPKSFVRLHRIEALVN